jgi:hypothetical protein
MIHKNFVVLDENCHWLLKLKCPAFFENVLWLVFIIPSGSLSLVKYLPCIVLYNINDKDTTNIVSLQMNVGFNT